MDEAQAKQMVERIERESKALGAAVRLVLARRMGKSDKFEVTVSFYGGVSVNHLQRLSHGHAGTVTITVEHNLLLRIV
jgi:hypothetical protein